MRAIFVRVVIFSALMLTLGLGAHCPPPSPPVQQLITCTEAALPGLAAQLPVLVARILADVATSNWFDLLAAAAVAGGPMYLCAEQFIIAELTSPPSTQPATPLRMMLTAKAAPGVPEHVIVARLQAHLAASHVIVKGP